MLLYVYVFVYLFGHLLRPYPLRTVIVGDGGGEVGSSPYPLNIASCVREALAVMKGTGVVPRDCCVDVFEGASDVSSG